MMTIALNQGGAPGRPHEALASRSQIRNSKQSPEILALKQHPWTIVGVSIVMGVPQIDGFC